MNALVTIEPFKAPALSGVMPLVQCLAWLEEQRGNPDGYIKLWRNLCSETGWRPLLINGELVIGTTDDSRVASAHWPRVTALVDHLDQSEMRPALMASLAMRGKRS